LAHREIDSLGDLLTNTTIEVCERLSIPYKPDNVNIVQLDNEIKSLAPALAKFMWDYFYSFQRFHFYFIAREQNKPWASQDELTTRETELTARKNAFYDQLDVFGAMAKGKSKETALAKKNPKS
jgi:hypothetical protein